MSLPLQAIRDVLLPTQPFAVDPLVRFLAAHAVPGLERHDAGVHTRLIPAAHGPALVTVAPADDRVTVDVVPADPADVADVVATVRSWLDLDADVAAIDAALVADPELAALVRARPGLRVPGAVDGFETALFAVLGQQVSLAAARTFAARLVAAFGVAGPDGWLSAPTPQRLSAEGPDAIRSAVGITGARARTLHALAVAVADGLALSPTADRNATRTGLLALAGVGPWTADYIALRALGDPDAFLSGDLVLRRAMGLVKPRHAEARAEAWRPYRSYAVLHLWTAAVYV